MLVEKAGLDTDIKKKGIAFKDLLKNQEEVAEQTEKIANMCLMANNESSPRSEVHFEHQLSSTSFVMHTLDNINEKHHKLQEAYNSLYEDNKIIKEDFIELKILLEKLIKNNKNLEMENANLIITNESLNEVKLENNSLKEELEQFKRINKNLEIKNSTLAVINENTQIKNQVLSEDIKNFNF